MKKIIRTAAYILLVTILTAMLPACRINNDPLRPMDDREKAEYITKRTDEYFESKCKSESTMCQILEGPVNGNNMKMEYSGTIKEIYSNQGADDIKYLSVQNVKSTTQIGTEKEVENRIITSGYADEYMFEGFKTDDKDASDAFFKSKLNAADYEPYLEAIEEKTEDVNFYEVCENVSVTLSDDKNTYIIKYSNGAANVNEKLAEWVGRITKSTGLKFKLESLELEYVADAKTFVIQSTKVKMITKSLMCDGKSFTCTIEQDNTFALPEGNESFLPENYDSYIETGDLRYFGYFSKRVSDINFSDDISFKLKSSLNVTSDGKIVSSYSETNTVNCGIKNDTYVYSIDATSSYENKSFDVNITFNGSRQIISVNGSGTETTDSNEFTAKVFLVGTITSAFNINISDVTEIKAQTQNSGNVKVTFTLDFDKKCEEEFESAGFTSDITDTLVMIVAEFDSEMNLVKMEYTMYGKSVLQGIKFTMIAKETIGYFGKADVSGITVVKHGSADF